MHDPATRDLDQPTRHGAEDHPTQSRAPSDAPAHVGHYRIVRELGRGGMGSVYLAARDDNQFSQTVAVKLINKGMDSEQIVRRFEHERRVLAALTHPNIARLLDGGLTDDGRPYFIMEYVDGVPIDTWCQRHRLRVEDRLQAFRKVCSALQYAHQNLVVHRDIKPGNILVGADGEPKLVDFGIAKLLGPGAGPGGAGAMTIEVSPMTPDYASPEQVRGDALTTTSDVYSLGVVLYELLTGRPPYKVTSFQFADIERVVCNTQPDRPSTAVSRDFTWSARSTNSAPPGGAMADAHISPEFAQSARESDARRLSRRLRGDLDNIVLMAMRKEPQRRYASAEQLSEDIRRHLEGLPVSAAPDSVSYRLTKFVRRRRVEVAAGAIVLASIVGVAAHAVWTARENARQRDEARVQRDFAERRFEQVRTLARTLMFDVYDSVERLQGSVPAREILVKTSLEYLDNLSKEVGDNIELKEELAAAYERVGDVQGGVRTGNLGKRDAALQSYSRALELRSQVVDAKRAAPEARRSLSSTQIRYADVLKATGDPAGALDALSKALETREQIARIDPASLQARRDLAIVLQELGDLTESKGDLASSASYYKRSLDIREQLAAETAGDEKQNPALLRDLSTGQLRMAQVLEEKGDIAGALELASAAALIRERLLKASPTGAREQRDLMIARQRIGQIHAARGESARAVEQHQAALTQALALVQANPSDARARRDLMIARESLGDACKNAIRLDEALEQYRALADLAEAALAADPASAEAARFLAGSRSRVGDILLARNEPNGAFESYRAYLAAADAAAKADPDSVIARRNLAVGHSKLASALLALAKRDEAVESLKRAERIHAELAAADPANIASRVDLAQTRVRQADILAPAGNRAGARDALQSAIASLDDAHQRDSANAAIRTSLADAHRKLAQVLAALGDQPAAIASLERARAIIAPAGASGPAADVRAAIEQEFARLGPKPGP